MLLRSFPVSVLLALATLPGCGDSDGSSRPPDPVAVVSEIEPNNDAFHANFLGALSPGDELRIHGTSDLGPFPFDGFAFVSGAPVAVEFVLSARDPSADLDLWVYDAALGEFVFLFEDPADPEVGSFEVLVSGAEFHLVVAPFLGVSDYTLQVRASCCSAVAEGAGRVAGRGAAAASAKRTAREGYSAAHGRGDEDDEELVELRGVLVEVDERGGMRARPLRVLGERSVPSAP
jgi:hypothetical protein